MDWALSMPHPTLPRTQPRHRTNFTAARIWHLSTITPSLLSQRYGQQTKTTAFGAIAINIAYPAKVVDLITFPIWDKFPAPGEGKIIHASDMMALNTNRCMTISCFAFLRVFIAPFYLFVKWIHHRLTSASGDVRSWQLSPMYSPSLSLSFFAFSRIYKMSCFRTKEARQRLQRRSCWKWTRTCVSNEVRSYERTKLRIAKFRGLCRTDWTRQHLQREKADASATFVRARMRKSRDENPAGQQDSGNGFILFFYISLLHFALKERLWG